MALPRKQAFPASKIAVGAVLYEAAASTDDDRKTTTAIQEWVVRSIRAKRGTKSRFGVASPIAKEACQYVNLTQKLEGVTWGKRSSKSGDYGWLNSIPTWCTHQFEVGQDLPLGIYTTVRAALVYAIANTEAHLEATRGYRDKEPLASEIAEWEIEISDLEAQLAALKRRLAKIGAKSPAKR